MFFAAQRDNEIYYIQMPLATVTRTAPFRRGSLQKGVLK
jgi:hypothetical protein